MIDDDITLASRLRFIGLVIAGVIVAGTAGYMLLEGWGLGDAVYMTIITLSTVGFGEVRPLTQAGRWFTSGLILVGVGGLAYLFSTIADYIVAGDLRGTVERRRMQRRIDDLLDHYIVCGYGRVGQQAVRELQANGAQVVVVDLKTPAAGTQHDKGQALFLVGDASDDEILRRAGIEQATGLIAAAGADADNVFITLSARAIKRDLIIVARGIMADSEPKLRKAGADHVILPHVIGGRRMAGIMMRPSVVDFLDVVMHSAELELWLEDVRILHRSELAGTTVGQAQIRSSTGANILAIKTADARLLTSVDAGYRFQPDDTMVALGTRHQLRTLTALAHGEPLPVAHSDGDVQTTAR